MTNLEPPPYESNFMAEEATPSGFPTGYFVIRNCANGRVLDVAMNSAQDGTHIVLWTAKDNSLVLPMRSPSADNQVFFVDHTGALCSKASGHAIDIEDGHLVLRHRKPFTLPFPNAESHPLPRITYVASSKLIRATFGCDPNYPPPNAPDPTNAWRSKDYILGAIPVRKSRSFLENTMAMMSTIGASLSRPQALISGPSAAPISTAFGHNDASASDFALHDDEVLEEERVGGEDDIDNNPEAGRPISLLELPIGWLEKGASKLSDAALRRRQWEVIPIHNHKRKTDHESA
ncbi:carbohydrate-binding module family 13 protein [Rhizoctonia solani AG-3 Rhs1AP]|uniref:Carbohydrate-binding module family 13 protein n=2 Tax=Rhizoctonia solani AG-3 TaxID=1086053 RepID=A0A074S1I9_9AGAM|nr:carbohydrate-binding module family 13 protein [Rhizoctonia solani AG-3 Rhs1AP]KEP51425.1 carbohydrate-binding module family 13 protein [Rhizoctonia solani 123E]